jgi:hypothetical protein
MRKTILLSALTALVFTSCQKQPKADFTLSKSECYIGETVTLSDKSVDAESYKWTIDNIEKGTTSSINYLTESTGVKLVKLDTYSKNGKKSSNQTKTLTVKNQNEAFKGNYIGNANSGCEIANLLIENSGENQIKFDLDGAYVYAIVNSTKSATLISNSSFDEYSDGSTLSITGGSVSLNGSSLTLTVNFSFYDATDNSTTSSSCTSAFNK